MRTPLLVASVFLLLSACFLAAPRTVLPGRLYMAGQPTAEECELWVRRLGIRSIVNLRGADPARPAFIAERSCTEAMGLERLDLRFLASAEPPRWLVREFVRRFPTLPEPVLVHCRAGVDRSALGAFLGVMLMGRPFTEAAAWIRSPLKHPCLRACTQKKFVDGFEAWCAREGRAPDRGGLIDYVERAYCPERSRCVITPRGVPDEAAPSGPVRFGAVVANSGPEPWGLSAEPDRGVRLGARLYGPLAAVPEDPEAFYYGRRNEGWDACRAGMEEGRVRPGETREWELAFSAPASPGLYLMAVDMVDEGRAWFSDAGFPPVFSLLRVGP